VTSESVDAATPEGEHDDGEQVRDDGDAAESTTARIARYARTTKARAEDLRDEATGRIEHLEAERDRHPFFDVLFAMRDEDRRIGGRELASALAYRIFFLLLPLVLVFVGGLGIAADSDPQAASDTVRESGVSAVVARNIADATAELSFLQHIGVLVVGVFGTWLAGLGLAKTLSRVSAMAFDLPLTKPANRTRVLVILLGLLAALLMLSSAWNTMRTDLGTIEFLVVLPVVGVVYAVVLTVLQLQFPRPDGVDWRGLVPGALLVGIGVAAMQAFVLGYVAHKLSSSNELYGGIGTAIALLLWFYLLGRALVLGPLLDAVLVRRSAAGSARG
jgi:uncharacterized BrkB/YihY/UPF0761 family membrane protein